MKNQIFLKPIVSHVAAALLPVAVLKHSFFVNDIAPGLQVISDEKQITDAVKKLLLDEVLETAYACIRISAAVENNQLQLTVNKRGPFALPLI